MGHATKPVTHRIRGIWDHARILLVILSCAVPATAAPSYPYNATLKNSTTVHCGPDRSYYSCQELPAGSEVEVHAVSDNGFLAIRPPQGSSSWVAAVDVQISGQSHAEVIRTGTVCWIGSQLVTPRDHNWQIQLKQGDQLQLLGKKTMQIHSDLPQANYFRVAPPALEFRWIRAADVATTSVASSRPADRWVDANVQQASATLPVTQAGGALQAEQAAWRNRHGQRPLRVAALDGPLAARGHQLLSQAGRQITLIDTQLSQLMAGSSDPGQLDSLRRSLLQLSEQGLGKALDKRVDTLLNRIGQLRRIQQNLAVQSSSTTSAQDSIYDVAGWLVQVHAAKRKAPPYAIVDENGKVIEFISPTPGLNLHPYLKKRVGVFGHQSYLSNLRTPHTTVYRVVDLARHQRR